jgi:hypothetical protein
MFCSLIKFLISSSMDSDRPFPGFVARHVSQCDQCREFAELTGDLDEKLHAGAQESGLTLESLLPEPTANRARPVMWRPGLAFAISCALVLITVYVARQMIPGAEEVPHATQLGMPSFLDTNPLEAMPVDELFERELASLENDATAAFAHILSVFPSDWGLEPEDEG